MVEARQAVEGGGAVQAAQEAAAQTQRSLIVAQRVAARTPAQTPGGLNLAQTVRFLGREEGEEPYDSWILRGNTSAEAILAHIQTLEELTQSEMERLINDLLPYSNSISLSASLPPRQLQARARGSR